MAGQVAAVSPHIQHQVVVAMGIDFVKHGLLKGEAERMPEGTQRLARPHGFLCTAILSYSLDKIVVEEPVYTLKAPPTHGLHSVRLLQDFVTKSSQGTSKGCPGTQTALGHLPPPLVLTVHDCLLGAFCIVPAPEIIGISGLELLPVVFCQVDIATKKGIQV